MAKEFVILVDEKDNPIGLEEKVKCHLPQGKLHRAFTALLFDKKGRLAIARRSDSKMLWPGDWDGTVASHPRESETYTSSAERRIPEELGISCKLDYLNKFEYHVPYKDIGSENEICGTVIGVLENSPSFKPSDEEISETRWVTEKELMSQLKEKPEVFCPWMIIALYFLPDSDKKILKKHESVLSDWINPNIKNSLKELIKFHLPDDNWRLVS